MPEENQGVFDKVKDAAEKVTDKVKNVFSDHGDKFTDAVGSAGDFVDDKTGGRFSEHIDKVRDTAQGAVDKLSGEGDRGGGATK